MKDFRFKVPQNIEFGVGSLKKLPEILNESKSEHVFLISDEGLAKLGVVKKSSGYRRSRWIKMHNIFRSCSKSNRRRSK